MERNEDSDVVESAETTEDDGEFHVIEDMGDESMEGILEEMVAAEPAAPTGDLDGLREENQQLRDSLLRVRADFDNFRKRMEREKGDYFRYALSGVISDLLPVLDNFERAIESAEGREDDFTEGVVMIYRQFSGEMEKAGLKPIDELNVPFDPNVHEAVETETRDDVPDHTVTGVHQKGFFLNGRLLRPALVKVAVAAPESGEIVDSETNGDQRSEAEE